jgi:predicted regulator of Ras-like GTPase activity (Roadblock/LC7/MglB family)
MFENVIAGLLRVDGVKGVAIVSRDGLLIEGQASDRTIDIESVAAMVATVYGTALNVSGEVFHEQAIDMVTLESPKGKILAVDAGENAVLAVITDPKVNLGLIRIYLGRNAEKVASML